MRGKSGALPLSSPTRTDTTSALAQDAALQAQLAAIIETSQDGVALIDQHGNFRYLNSAGRNFLSVQQVESISTLSLLDFCPPQLQVIFQQEAIPTALSTGQWSAELEFISRQKHTFPALIVLFSHTKPNDEETLLSLILRDISEQKRREAELAYLAHHDALTGLFNRRRFQEELENRLALTRRYGTSGAILFMDVDGLKVMNDSFGHQAGDTVLIDLASLFRAQLREVDVVARFGGDEFAVILSSSDIHTAPTVAARLLHAIHQHTTKAASGNRLFSTISIGIAFFPQHGATAEELLKSADLALYQAKTEGRNRYYIFTPSN